MHKTCFALLALVGCVPPGTYVSDIRYDGSGNLVAQKCNFDYRGRATDECHLEDLGQPPPQPAVTVAKRAAPTRADVDRALASPGVYHSVELCREQLEPTLDRLSFTLALAPSGKLAITPHDGSATFADCASRALAGANLLAYDGAPVQFEETLVFSGSPGAGG